ncbi:MAG TPA: ASKHA domain-containing protein [Candidatus Dormibacteraeota bacterium]|nr:ASKHA domain-containing protein [Candidatus Dormibacteraeota bacterium]
MSSSRESVVAGHWVTFEPGGDHVWSLPAETLLDTARRVGVRIASVCGGRGLCHSCVVRVTEGPAGPPSQPDLEFFTTDELADSWRRACQTVARTDCRVEISERARATPLRTEVESEDVWVRPDPSVRLYPVTVAAPSLEHPEADDNRLLFALNEKWPGTCSRIDLDALRRLPVTLRALAGQVVAVVRFGEVIDIVPTTKAPLPGLAVDIGTSNIGVLLVDLRNGRTLASRAMENPQTRHGADVITRIGKARASTERQKQLHDLVVAAINEVARELCESQSLTTDQIVDVVVAGNTVMHHFLLRLPVDYLGAVPFVAASARAVDVKARDIGIRAAPGAYVHAIANIAGFVGGDHTAVLLAVGADEEKKTVVALDIGTNTEISLLHQGRLLSISCPSGPALEGGHIRCGMRSAPGAIESVRISGDRVDIKTIANARPIGICGSGVVDAAAQLYMAGVVSRTGRMVRDHPRVRMRDEQPEFVLADERATNGPPIVFNQRDVRAVQLAKGAIRAGIQVLLEEESLSEAQIDQVIVAGAFGNYIDLASAVAIGMFPNLPLDRFAQVGNAAGIGAKLALVSYPHRAAAQSLAARSHYIELAGSGRFNHAFMRAMRFPELNGS